MEEVCKIMGCIEEEMDDEKEFQKWWRTTLPNGENAFDEKLPTEVDFATTRRFVLQPRGEKFCNHEEKKIGLHWQEEEGVVTT